jgi:hypothetical protein
VAKKMGSLWGFILIRFVTIARAKQVYLDLHNQSYLFPANCVTRPPSMRYTRGKLIAELNIDSYQLKYELINTMTRKEPKNPKTNGNMYQLKSTEVILHIDIFLAVYDTS